MELEYIKKKMEEFDFVKYSVKMFIENYNVSDSFVRKKLKIWNIPHATKKRNILTNRDRFGRYCLLDISKLNINEDVKNDKLKLIINDKMSKKVTSFKEDVKNDKMRKKVTSFKEFNAKYKQYA